MTATAGSDAKLATFLAALSLTDAARPLLQGATGIRQCVEILVQHKLHGDALLVAARALPHTYAIAWLCECLRAETALGRELTFEDKAGLSLAERWLKEQSETNRRTASEFAEKAEYASVAAWLAAAVGWTGGSMAPADLPVVAPPPHLTGQAAFAVIQLLATRVPEKYPERQAGYVQRALSLLDNRR